MDAKRASSSYKGGLDPRRCDRCGRLGQPIGDDEIYDHEVKSSWFYNIGVAEGFGEVPGFGPATERNWLTVRMELTGAGRNRRKVGKCEWYPAFAVCEDCAYELMKRAVIEERNHSRFLFGTPLLWRLVSWFRARW